MAIKSLGLCTHGIPMCFFFCDTGKQVIIGQSTLGGVLEIDMVRHLKGSDQKEMLVI